MSKRKCVVCGGENTDYCRSNDVLFINEECESIHVDIRIVYCDDCEEVVSIWAE